jgi:hypothetical protein
MRTRAAAAAEAAAATTPSLIDQMKKASMQALQPEVKQPPIAWLPASWTLALLAAALATTSAVAVGVPEPYMVRLANCRSIPPTDSCVPDLIISPLCCCSVPRSASICCPLPTSSLYCLLQLVSLPPSASMPVGRAIPCANGAALLSRTVSLLGPKDHHISRPVCHWRCLCLGGGCRPQLCGRDCGACHCRMPRSATQTACVFVNVPHTCMQNGACVFVSDVRHAHACTCATSCRS